jgi:hypothetical protein
MRRAASAIIATCLCLSAASAADQRYLIDADDGYGDYETDFYYELLADFYEYLERSEPGEYREYPRPYVPPVDPCEGEDEYYDCTYPGGPAPGSEGGWPDSYNG